MLSPEGGNRTFVVTATKADDAPPEPSILILAAVKATSVSLNWSANPDGDFASYTVYRNDDSTVNNGDHLLAEITDRNDTTLTDTGLASLDTFYYRVYTTDTKENSSAGNVAKAVTTARRTLSGTITSVVGGSPVEGATVRILGTNDSTLTGTDGSYLINNPVAGAATVKVSKSGFIARGDTATVPSTGGVFADLGLLAMPSMREIGSGGDFVVEPNDIACDDDHAYALERDWVSPKIVVINTSSGQRTVSHAIADHCANVPAEIVHTEGDVYVACPDDRKILRVVNAATSAGGLEALDLQFSPYGLCADSGQVCCVGVGAAGAGEIVALTRGSLSVAKRLTIPAFAASYDGDTDRGPKIAAADGVVYVINAGRTSGRIAKVDLAGEAVDKTVDLPWTTLNGLALHGDRVYVSSRQFETDSVLVFDQDLNRLAGVYTGGSLMKLAACSRGRFAGYVVATTDLSSILGPKALLLDPLLPSPAGVIDFANEVRTWEFLPSGVGAVITTGFTVHATETE